MKRLVISSLILASLLAVALLNGRLLQQTCRKTAELLGSETEPVTLEQIEQAQTHWENHMVWFDTMLNNAEIDHVDEEFQMLRDLMDSDNRIDIITQRNKLLQLIEDIGLAERVTVGNVF